MTVYHNTSYATDAPPVAIDRLCDELRRLATSLGTPRLQVGHRALATAIGCSASRIPALMQRLEDAGWITRDPWKNGYLIDVSPLIDQPPSPLIDQGMPGVIDQPPPESQSPQQDAPNERDRRHSRNAAYKVLDHESRSQEAPTPLFERLIAQPNMSRSLAMKIARTPIGTLADFLHDLRIAQMISDIRTPFWFTVAKWRDGQRVEAPEERPDERANQPRRARPSAPQRQPDATRATPPERGPVRTQLIY
jgi:hypothetical protein